MKRRKHRYRGYSKRTIILIIALFCSLFFGMGYSLLGTSLDIFGDVGVSKYDHTLYGVFEKSYNKNDRTRLYSGLHNDSYDTIGTENIYYWYQSSSGGSAYNNNVIFADQCWQMYRTTDVGGVKMMYNGEAVGGKCLSDRNTHLGYYTSSTVSLLPSYWYGTDYTYDSNNNVFSLSGNVTSGNVKIGEYTCASSSVTDTCSELYQVYQVSSGNNYSVLKIKSDVNYSIIGYLPFNIKHNSLSDFGYMFGPRHTHISTQFFKQTNFSFYTLTQTMSTSHWYADDVVWNETTNKWELVNPYQVSTKAELAGLINKYSFFDSDQTTSKNFVYYITKTVTSSYSVSAYSAKIENGHDLSYYNRNFSYGDSYIDNGDGTYTIVDGTSYDFFEGAYVNPTIVDKFVCIDAVDDTCSTIMFVHSAASYYNYLDLDQLYKYSNGFSYENGHYILDDVSVSYNLPTENAHYTCWNQTGICDTISYIIDLYYDGKTHYYNFTNGDDIEDLLSDSFETNVNNSVVKTAIDSWYQKNLIGYESYIDDVIYCNKRKPKNESFVNPSGGSIHGDFPMYYALYYDNHFECESEYDQFSKSNPNARLTYPIGLASAEEAYSGLSYSLTSSYTTWMLSSLRFLRDFTSWFALGYHMTSTGGVNRYDGQEELRVSANRGIRPVIALKAGTEYVSGTGSKEDPYIVDAIPGEYEDYTLTIHYYLHLANNSVQEVFDPIEVTLPYGTDYYYESPVLDNTTVNLPEVSGTLYEHTDIEVHYYEIGYRLTVNYWYFPSGTKAADSYSVIYSAGSSYSVTSPIIIGYTPDMARVTGTMNEDTVYNVYYTANSYQLTILYEYQDGVQAYPTYSTSIQCDTSYNVPSPTISGFTTDFQNVSGTIPCSAPRDITYTIIYYANPTPP